MVTRLGKDVVDGGDGHDWEEINRTEQAAKAKEPETRR
jgi:hypothetical protein